MATCAAAGGCSPPPSSGAAGTGRLGSPRKGTNVGSCIKTVHCDDLPLLVRVSDLIDVTSILILTLHNFLV